MFTPGLELHAGNMEAMDSVVPGLGLGAPSKVSH